jgi:hypothetical protein
MYWDSRWSSVRVANSWRIEDDWWRPGAEIVRDYYRVWTASWLVAVIFHDERAGGWYLEKILD